MKTESKESKGNAAERKRRQRLRDEEAAYQRYLSENPQVRQQVRDAHEDHLNGDLVDP